MATRHRRLAFYFLLFLLAAGVGTLAYKLSIPQAAAPVVPPTVVASALPTAPTPPPVAATTNSPVLDLFQPSPQQAQQQVTQSQLSQKMEDAIIVCYTLVRCDLMSQSDYEASYRALEKYVVAQNLGNSPAESVTKLRSIASAASASYTMIYSNHSCADPDLKQKASSLAQWRDSILSN